MFVITQWVKVYHCLLGSDISSLCLSILLPLSWIFNLFHTEVLEKAEADLPPCSQPLVLYSDLHFSKKIK